MYKNRIAPCINSTTNSADFTQEPFNKTLKFLEELVQDKKTNESLCDYLISVAPTEEEKNIILSIRDDELNHCKLLKEVYKYYTCEEIQSRSNEKFIVPSSYIEGICKAIFSELDSIEKYRFIRNSLPIRLYNDTMFTILTDEIENASKYNYILANNSNDYYRQKVFTLSELAQYDGTMGKPKYVAVKGIVYDVSNVPNWSKSTHYGLTAGKDLSSQFESCHGVESKLAKLPKVGVLKV